MTKNGGASARTTVVGEAFSQRSQTDTDDFTLGDLEPAVSAAEMADLRACLDGDPLSPPVILELVALARQVGAVLMDVSD